MNRLVHAIIERCRASVTQALHDVEITARDIDRIVFVGGATRMPAVREFFEELLGRKAEMGVDPMECVAQGAAIRAGVLAGEMGEMVLVDVTPLMLEIETLCGVARPLIARNTPIPLKRLEIFTTAADMQTAVIVHVFQGERPMAADNTSLGKFNQEGLAPAPRGIPKIEETFDIDADGILNATAKDTATGKSQSIRITGAARDPGAEPISGWSSSFPLR
ncbi:MAG: Hsp70 family protein [Hyphomicrobiales bacterium]|nr:Hsp70 family protein [Hyphomicrobiales bacterium]